MIFAKMRELHTARLVLRMFRAEDAPLYFQNVTSRPEVTRYMLWDTHRQLSDTESVIQTVLNRYASGSSYRWCVAMAETDCPIGAIELLRFDEEAESCSFAYMIGSGFWGRGYATEALEAALRFAFKEMELQTVTADHMAENRASGKVMQKAGMRYQKTIPGKYEKNGKSMDALEYCITREDWQKLLSKD